jgi:pseudouridine-5'-phosphate glycosidase
MRRTPPQVGARSAARSPALPAFLFSACFGLSAMLTLSAASSPAQAKKASVEEGVEVTIVVQDAAGEPIPTAVVRHPGEAARNRVNAVNGEWKNSRVYLPDGSEMLFLPGMSLQLEVSAPGFMLRIVTYDIRKRNNRVVVVLEPMPEEQEEMEEPMIQFGRERPIEGSGAGGPVN